MKKKNIIPVLLAALSLCACGKEAVELDVSARAEYIEKIKPSETTSNGKAVYEGSDEGIDEKNMGNSVIKALPKDIFLEKRPEGAEYYEDMIRNRLSMQYTNNGLALVHFDSDALPELLVIDGDTHYCDGKLYSIGQDGRPYLMLKFIPVFGSISYLPYTGIYREEFGGDGCFTNLYLKYENAGVQILNVTNYDGNDISDDEDGTLAPIKYYLDIPVSESLKIVMADPMNVIGVASRIEGASDLNFERARAVDANEYYEFDRSYNGTGLVKVTIGQ